MDNGTHSDKIFLRKTNTINTCFMIDEHHSDMWDYNWEMIINDQYNLLYINLKKKIQENDVSNFGVEIIRRILFTHGWDSKKIIFRS